MSELINSETLDKLWAMSNVKGYPCPLYAVHSRAYIFPNKDVWIYHITQEHTQAQREIFIDIKLSFIEYSQLYEEAIKELKSSDSTLEDVRDNDE